MALSSVRLLSLKLMPRAPTATCAGAVRHMAWYGQSSSLGEAAAGDMRFLHGAKQRVKFPSEVSPVPKRYWRPAQPARSTVRASPNKGDAFGLYKPSPWNCS